ncbi:MAG: hypothetical protein E7315_01820 [Clostridiales bacterium]|nr:hypothetical protein [Clostridiales bacterium]
MNKRLWGVISFLLIAVVFISGCSIFPEVTPEPQLSLEDCITNFNALKDDYDMMELKFGTSTQPEEFEVIFENSMMVVIVTQEKNGEEFINIFNRDTGNVVFRASFTWDSARKHIPLKERISIMTCGENPFVVVQYIAAPRVHNVTEKHENMCYVVNTNDGSTVSLEGIERIFDITADGTTMLALYNNKTDSVEEQGFYKDDKVSIFAVTYSEEGVAVKKKYDICNAYSTVTDAEGGETGYYLNVHYATHNKNSFVILTAQYVVTDVSYYDCYGYEYDMSTGKKKSESKLMINFLVHPKGEKFNSYAVVYNGRYIFSSVYNVRSIYLTQMWDVENNTVYRSKMVFNYAGSDKFASAAVYKVNNEKTRVLCYESSLEHYEGEEVQAYYFKFYNSSEFGISSRLDYTITPGTNTPVFEDESLETYFTLQRVETAVSGIDKLVTDLLELSETVNGISDNYMNLPNDTLDGGAVPVLFGSRLYIIKVR